MKSTLTAKEREAIFREELAKQQAKEQQVLVDAQKEYNEFMEQWSVKYGTQIISVLQVIKK